MAKFASAMILLLVVTVLQGQAYSQDLRAKTGDGRQVVLKSDGTWKFMDAKPSEESSGTYQRSESAKSVYNVKGGKVAFFFDPTKWIQKKSDDPNKVTFEHREGDVYGMLIAERIAIPVSKLRELALKNAQTAAPDIKVVKEENRTVNGTNILCMQMDGTIEGINFTYFGYYYAGKSGTIQLLTYTSQNLFQESQPEMSEFLNGLEVKE
ncbi:MAG: hypothetical protein AB9866_03085 [Syntrophobacteraceae bacterium]